MDVFTSCGHEEVNNIIHKSEETRIKTPIHDMALMFSHLVEHTHLLFYKIKYKF